MAGTVLRVAIVSEIFHGKGAATRLGERLRESAAQGAQVALLPELPLDPWIPATDQPCEEDAEEPGGPRHAILAEAAASARIAVIGGAIVVDAQRKKRQGTALVFDERGDLRAAFAKTHLPDEPGFREKNHYEAAIPFDLQGWRLGLQVCSDLNRPEGCHLLGALGAEVVLAPRATERRTWPTWRTVMIADALTSGCFLCSVNRPEPEGVGLGGPSIVVAPDGAVLAETEDLLVVVALERDRLEQAHRGYPGSLPVRADLYARGWASAARLTRQPPE